MHHLLMLSLCYQNTLLSQRSATQMEMHTMLLQLMEANGLCSMKARSL